ncbi:unnamed protein product [Calicophoron daubneyi]|uniref:Serine aminopeptidase S33 domain-containing protein n=1 Tax=Calicophoron daubneyi TaxID=300641 RepID=A0AAV2T8M5_CALDB
MNELTCNSICQLLCCPPLPSKIAAKLAFMPPPASYQLVPVKDNDEEKLSLTFAPFLKESFIHFFPSDTEVTVATTRKGSKIATVYMHLNPSTKLTFLLSHGNAVDLGLMINFMHELGSKLGVNMMCYDYSGYGASTGKPLEKNLYADAECALSVLRTKFSVPLDQIILYGQSIGTVPTVYLATMFKVAAVVLHSPLMSGLRVAFPRLKRNYCCDVFSNVVRAPRIVSPTLIIHGTNDEIIHPAHALKLYELLPNALEPLFIRGAGHNDCELYEEYLIRLEYLVHVEVPAPLYDTVRSRFDLTHDSGRPNSPMSLNPHLSSASHPSSASHRTSAPPTFWHHFRSPQGSKSSRISPLPTQSQCTSSVISPKMSAALPNGISRAVAEGGETKTYTKSATSSWLRRRGMHGSYRYMGKAKRKDKSGNVTAQDASLNAKNVNDTNARPVSISTPQLSRQSTAQLSDYSESMHTPTSWFFTDSNSSRSDIC